MLRSASLFLACVAVGFTSLAPGSQAASAQALNGQSASWEASVQQRREELIRKNGPGTDPALRDQLLKMLDEDQAVRGFIHGKQVSVMTTMTKPMIDKLAATDNRLTSELKQIVAAKGWPTISLVGIDASGGAMLILTHTPDHDWQRRLLPQLQALVNDGKIDGSPLALVIDKELVAEGKLQRYGSQFKFINGKMAMYAVEDPSTLDQRRAQAHLVPMSIYKEMLAQIYHQTVTDDTVMATAPKKQ